MKTPIKIPRGWRVLRKGEIVRARDKYFLPVSERWFLPPICMGYIGDEVGGNFGDLDTQPWIRRIAVKKKAVKRGRK
jgi:hypothetical protein